MERLLNLPPGLRIKDDKFMLDFRHENIRYRVTTTFNAKNENLTKASKLLSSIKLDIERDLFHLHNYKRLLKTPQVLSKLDKDYVEQEKLVYVQDLLKEQLEHYQKRVAAKTLAQSTCNGYKYIIHLHLIPFFKDVAITDVTNLMLEDLIKKLPFSRKRINCILNPLRSIFTKAQKLGFINNNPMDKIDKNIFLTTAINSDYEVKPFSLEEIQKILSNCEHDGIKNLIMFGFWTGMRIGEIFALEWSDIDFTNELISVSKSSSVQGLIKSPKTKAGIRDIEMTPSAKTALLEQLKITKDLSHNRVFASPVHQKKWVKSSAFRAYWKQALEKANVEYRNPHQMRHTFISYMLSVGNNPLILYRMVGHSDPTVMYKKYARFIRQAGGEKLLKIV